MKIYPREPDLQTICSRIRDGSIDLQPDFQRDLVWSIQKKQSLIDTILREWHFPPVFLVVPVDGVKLDVLDGQQRLDAIFDFFEDRIVINGNIEPIDVNIQRLDGLVYSQLPVDIRSRVNRYSFRVCELSDYKEDEPHELFFRLNQGTVLTPAEKRNTLYGPVRNQVRRLVVRMMEQGLNIETIGFNNNRLSYQDVISRLLYALKTGDINRKITDQLLIDFFRHPEEVSDSIYARAELAIDKLCHLIGKKVKLNKPTLLTWLIFLSLDDISRDLFYEFDSIRVNTKSGEWSNQYIGFIMNIYQDKSASSVNDTIPVQMRLLAVYLVLFELGANLTSSLGECAQRIRQELLEIQSPTESKLGEIMNSHGWGCV